MRNPLGWILGYFWSLIIRYKMRMGGNRSTWMPRWIQPYFMRCMGWEVNEAVLAFYHRGEK